MFRCSWNVEILLVFVVEINGYCGVNSYLIRTFACLIVPPHSEELGTKEFCFAHSTRDSFFKPLTFFHRPWLWAQAAFHWFKQFVISNVTQPVSEQFTSVRHPPGDRRRLPFVSTVQWTSHERSIRRHIGRRTTGADNDNNDRYKCIRQLPEMFSK